MEDEVKTVEEVISMTMAKARYYMNKDMEKAEVDIPRINECNGVRLYKPSVTLYDEFLILSTDFKFSEGGVLWDGKKIKGDESKKDSASKIDQNIENEDVSEKRRIEDL